MNVPFQIKMSYTCRINRDFEQQMENFISGTLAFLENSGAKRVRDNVEDGSPAIDKDRR